MSTPLPLANARPNGKRHPSRVALTLWPVTASKMGLHSVWRSRPHRVRALPVLLNPVVQTWSCCPALLPCLADRALLIVPAVPAREHSIRALVLRVSRTTYPHALPANLYCISHAKPKCLTYLINPTSSTAAPTNFRTPSPHYPMETHSRSISGNSERY